MKVEVKEMHILGPAPHLCQQCATDHPPGDPHDQRSYFWHSWFFKCNGKWPTWADAMAHCDPETRQLWCEATAEVLREKNQPVPNELLEGAGG